MALIKFVFISGLIDAIKDLWIIGDKFIHGTFHTLQKIQRENKLAKRREFYIYEEYNVCCFTANPLSNVHNTAARILNSLIKALNDYNNGMVNKLGDSGHVTHPTK